MKAEIRYYIQCIYDPWPPRNDEGKTASEPAMVWCIMKHLVVGGTSEGAEAVAVFNRNSEAILLQRHLSEGCTIEPDPDIVRGFEPLTGSL